MLYGVFWFEIDRTLYSRYIAVWWNKILHLRLRIDSRHPILVVNYGISNTIVLEIT